MQIRAILRKDSEILAKSEAQLRAVKLDDDLDDEELTSDFRDVVISPDQSIITSLVKFTKVELQEAQAEYNQKLEILADDKLITPIVESATSMLAALAIAVVGYPALSQIFGVTGCSVLLVLIIGLLKPVINFLILVNNKPKVKRYKRYIYCLQKATILMKDRNE